MKFLKFLGIEPKLKAKVRLEDHDEMDFGRERENGPIRRPLGRQSLDSGFRHNEKKQMREKHPGYQLFVISRHDVRENGT